MFERFTQRARRALVVAQDEARSLNHSFLEPEHLLLGVMQGDGLAATALSQLGLSLEEVRASVTAALPQAKANIGSSKVPFSPRAKKALEMSLREALRLGHNYIGTEHVALGVLRVIDADSLVVQALGTGVDDLRARVLEIVASGTAPESPPRSRAVEEALQRARQLAGEQPVTTGHVVLGVLADGGCQAGKALAMLEVTTESFEAKLAEVPVIGTSDGPPPPRSVGITLGQVTTTIDDPDLAAALGDLTAEQLQAALRRALSSGPEHGPRPEE